MKKIIFLLFLLIVIKTDSNAQVNLAQGLQLYYDFNGNANDQSGNNNNGIVNGAILVQDKWGNPNGAYQFDGIDDFIDVMTSSSLNFSNENFTLYSLINVQGFYQGLCHGNYIISRGADNVPGALALGYSDAIYTNNQHCNIPIPDTLHQNYSVTTANSNTYIGSLVNANYITQNTWNCVIATGSTDSVKVYVDAVLVYKAYRTGSGATSNANIHIGKQNNTSSNFLFPFLTNAIIDELRIYNRAINDQEINALCEYAFFPESVNDISKIKSFEISPNPATDYLTIKTKENNEQVQFSIVDVSGKLIKNEKAVIHAGAAYRLDIHTVSKGIYFLKITIDGKTETHKFVVE